jgi:hypothetical protein
MRPLIAHCRRGLGHLYARTGQREDACEHLITAASMYSELDLPCWLEQVETEMKALA